MKTPIERASSYLFNAAMPIEFVAFLARRSGSTSIAFVTPENVLKAIKDGAPFVPTYADGVRTRAVTIAKIARYASAIVDLPNEYARLTEGRTRETSGSVEKLVFDALTSNIGRWVYGREKLPSLLNSNISYTGENHRRGNYDILVEYFDGRRIWLEVKGNGGRLYHSSEAFEHE